MDRLPNILRDHIFNKLSLRDALNASYASRAWRKTVLPYLHGTYNINRYLSSSFPKSTALLATFRETGTIISGSRALAFFLPSVRPHTLSSDWDIYVPHPHQRLLHHELLRQDFLPVERKKLQRRPAEFLVYDYVNDSGCTAQIVALVEGRSVFDCLMGFHTSVVQNFISGWGCYSMHWKSTFNGRGWMAQRADDWTLEAREELIAKYTAKGMRLVPWNERDDSDAFSPVEAYTFSFSDAASSIHTIAPRFA